MALHLGHLIRQPCQSPEPQQKVRAGVDPTCTLSGTCSHEAMHRLHRIPRTAEAPEVHQQRGLTQLEPGSQFHLVRPPSCRPQQVLPLRPTGLLWGPYQQLPICESRVAHIPKTAIVSCTSDIPQHNIGNYVGQCATDMNC